MPEPLGDDAAMSADFRSVLLASINLASDMMRALPRALNRAAQALGQPSDCPSVDEELLLLVAKIEAKTRGNFGLAFLGSAAAAFSGAGLAAAIPIFLCRALVAARQKPFDAAAAAEADKPRFSPVTVLALLLFLHIVYFEIVPA